MLFMKFLNASSRMNKFGFGKGFNPTLLLFLKRSRRSCFKSKGNKGDGYWAQDINTAHRIVNSLVSDCRHKRRKLKLFHSQPEEMVFQLLHCSNESLLTAGKFQKGELGFTVFTQRQGWAYVALVHSVM